MGSPDPINDVATLNMRSAPSTGASIVTRLADGQNLRNLGCRMAEGRRWCQVATLADPGFEGWAAGEYLIEGTGTPTRAEAAPSPKPKIVTGSGQERVGFASGSSDARLQGGLQPGKSRRYLLNARDGQYLNLRVMVQEAPLTYRIYNPDKSPLLGDMTTSKDYRGQLFQSGDHVIEVINSTNAPSSYELLVAVK